MVEARRSYRLAYERGGKLYRLTRVMFGTDGSYYVAAPVHPERRALLTKFTVNYAKQEMQIPISEAVDLGAAGAEDKEIKLSHHPDGFMQFSGAGLVSGRDADGSIRGVGVDTWTLDDPNRGPAFGIVITDIEQFGSETSDSADTLVFTADDVTPLDGADQLIFEGYYFPPLWRRFIRRDGRGNLVIRIFHPAKAVLELRVVLPTENVELPGFLGFELYTGYLKDEDEEPRPGFIMSGSTGNVRRNEAGETLADGIHCMYPADDFEISARNLDYVRDYVMNEIDPGGPEGPVAAKPTEEPKGTGPGTI